MMKCRDRQTGQLYRFIGSGYNLTNDWFVSIFAEDFDSGCLLIRESDEFNDLFEMVPDPTSIGQAMKLIGAIARKTDNNIIALGALQLLKENGFQPNSTELIQAYRRAQNEK